MSEVDGEDLFRCPYDSTHMVRLKRMPYHLMLCRKNFPNSGLISCPFNALHEVPKAELRYHISMCGDKYRIEQEVAGKGSSAAYKGCTDVPEYKNHQECQPRTEDWDAEACRQPKVFILGESFKYDPNIVGPEDYISTTLGSERDAETVTLLRQQYAKNMLENDTGTSWTRLPSVLPKVLDKPAK